MQGLNENYIFTFPQKVGKIVLSIQKLFSQKSSNLYEYPFTNVALNPKTLQKSDVEKKILVLEPGDSKLINSS